MISRKECQEQIKSIQKYLNSNKNMSDIERIAIYDTLTFYLDMQALLAMKDIQTSSEKN